jgi:hypothetical protein
LNEIAPPRQLNRSAQSWFLMNDLPWEDYLLERKVESDLKDLLKTLVAFANSVMPGHIATILIGETDDGIAAGVTNPQNIQDRIRKECERIYPSIIWRSTVYETNNKHCVRVEIEYSGDTPHFGGSAWVRRGNATHKASDEMFQRLVELRLEPVREISKWVGKEILVRADEGQFPPTLGGLETNPRWPTPGIVTVKSVNRFWITVQTKDGRLLSEPLDKVTLSFSNQQKCLELFVKR